MDSSILLVGLVIGVLCGAACGAIATSKGLHPGGYFLLGLLLGLIGILITACARRAPAGIAGWYPDPWRLAASRWYDGNQWTELITPGPSS